MGKKKHAAAIVYAARSSKSKEIQNLKSLNEQLQREVGKSRKQIEQLRFELLKSQNNKLIKEVKELRKKIEQLDLEFASQTTEQDILADMERDVIRLVISSVLTEATTRENMEMDAVMKKTESAAAELNVVKMRLISLHREKDKNQEKMKRMVKERDSMLRSLKQKRKAADPPESEHGGRMWRKWIYPVVAAATSFFVATAAVILFFFPKTLFLKLSSRI